MDNQQPMPKKGRSKNAQKYQIVVGQTYGAYLVIGEVEVKTPKCIEVRWEAQHSVTGKIIKTKSSYLAQVDETYKRKLREGNYQKGLRSYLYQNSKSGAEKRKHSHQLTFEEFDVIISKSCYYCGDAPKKSTNLILIKRGHINEPPIYYNGIDRIDSNMGYEKDNVVPCCSVCNYMKHTSNVVDFYNQIEKIFEQLSIRKGSTTIAKASTPEANVGGNGDPLTGYAEGEDIVSSI